MKIKDYTNLGKATAVGVLVFFVAATGGLIVANISMLTMGEKKQQETNEKTPCDMATEEFFNKLNDADGATNASVTKEKEAMMEACK